MHGKFNLDPYTILIEYTGAMHKFNAANLSFNNHGARPQAFDLEGGYNFEVWKKPSSFALDYGFTRDALALLLPQQSMAATFNISIWPNTIASLELRHNINYANDNTASGQNIVVTPNHNHIVNELILRLAAYF